MSEYESTVWSLAVMLTDQVMQGAQLKLVSVVKAGLIS